MIRAALFLIALAAAALPARAGDPGSGVLVELYTSQGCSACPPADEVLAELAEQDGVVALSFFVSYWDYLGWQDTLAIPEATARQRDYAKRVGKMRVYTPQMILDGEDDIIGSRRAAVTRAVETCAALRARGTGPAIAIVPDGGVIRVRIGDGAAASAHEVWLMHVSAREVVAIGAGENAGRTQVYANVVRAITRLGAWQGRAVTFEAAVQDMGAAAGRIAVVVQGEDRGPVAAAAIVDLP